MLILCLGFVLWGHSIYTVHNVFIQYKLYIVFPNSKPTHQRKLSTFLH